MKRILLMGFVLLMSIAGVWAQERTVSGIVTAADDGSAVPGVNVLVKGTTTGTTTDTEGSYSLSVPASGTLVFSFIGFATQEVAVGNRTAVDVQLASDIQQLGEVVVTALGIEREQKSLGYAVQEIKGESLNRVKETNVVNSLQGKVAGIQVQGNQGALGGSSRILIRGARSISGENQPLFVVDGVPLNNQNFNSADTERGAGGVDYGNAAQYINSEDVESVSVLKGASAAALYGNRAANGVIIVTTKKGKQRKGIGIDVSSDVQIQDLLVVPDYQNQYGGGAGPFARNENGQDVALFRVDESWGPRLDGRPVRQFYSYYDFIPQYFGQATPWVAQPDNVRDFFQTGIQNTNSVALSGGNDKGTFRIGYTNLNARGVVPENTLTRGTLSFNGTLNLTPKLKTSIGVNYVTNKAEARAEQGYSGVMVQFNHFGQRQVDMGLLDNYWITPTGEQITWNRRSEANAFPQYANNPYWIQRKNYPEDRVQRLFGNASVTYSFTDYLDLSGSFYTDYYVDRREERIADGSLEQTYYSEDVREVQESNAELRLSFNKNLGDLFSLTAFVGGNLRANTFRRNAANTIGGLSVPDFFNLQNSVERPTIVDETSERNINSAFGAVNVGYRDLVFLEATLRNDWSSTLPAGNNSFLYPSVSGSFVFSQLGALQNIGILSFGKIRASFAQVGNDTDPYRLGITYQPQANYGPNPRFRLPLTLNNPNLKPESTNSYEVGADVRFFQNRLNVDVSYYQTFTTDQIFAIPVAGSSGYTNRVVNAGETSNKGIEVALSGSPIATEDFRWDIGVNWARNRNRLEELAPGINNLVTGIGPFVATIEARPGQPLNTIVGPDFERDPDGNKIVNDDGTYPVSTTLSPLGSVLPDWTGGITNSFNYKGINLSFLISAQKGGNLFSLSSMFGKYSGLFEETAADNIRQVYMVAEGVKNVGTDEEPQYVPNDIEVNPQTFFSSLFGHGGAYTYDASFVKLREMSLGYSLPVRILEKTPFSKITFSLIGRNLAILYRQVPHLDPESAVNGSGNIQGYEGGAFPSQRSYGFSVNFGL